MDPIHFDYRMLKGHDPEYIRNLQITSSNQRFIDSQYNKSLNKRLGLVPTRNSALDDVDPIDHRPLVLQALKVLTNEPRKFYNMLYSRGEIDTFYNNMKAFFKASYLEGGQSADTLLRKWNKFISLLQTREINVEGVPRDEVKIYNELEDLIYDDPEEIESIKQLGPSRYKTTKGVKVAETKGRKQIDNEERTNRFNIAKSSIEGREKANRESITQANALAKALFYKAHNEYDLTKQDYMLQDYNLLINAKLNYSTNELDQLVQQIKLKYQIGSGLKDLRYPSNIARRRRI